MITLKKQQTILKLILNQNTYNNIMPVYYFAMFQINIIENITQNLPLMNCFSTTIDVSVDAYIYNKNTPCFISGI